MWFLPTKKKRCTRPRVLLISALMRRGENEPALDYFGMLTEGVAQALEERGFDLVVKVPSIKPDLEDSYHQVRLLEQALRWTHCCYEGLIVSPIETKPLVRHLIGYMQSYPSYPILTIDKSLERHGTEIRAADTIDVPPSVIANSKLGGENAARCLWDQFRKSYSEGIGTFMVLEGLEGSEDRVKGFEDWMSSQEMAAVIPIEARKLNFDQPSAMAYVAGLLQNGIMPHGIFCCNDEMALGAREALMQRRRSHPDEFEDLPAMPQVVGFDGIGDVHSILNTPDPDPFLLGTIDVRIRIQVEKLCEMFQTILDDPDAMRDLSGPERHYEQDGVLVTRHGLA